MSTRYRLTFAHGALAPGKDTFASMTAANLFGLYCPVKWGKFAVELVDVPDETNLPAPGLGVGPQVALTEPGNAPGKGLA